MDKTFGNMLLSVNQIIDGKTLAYGYSNRSVPDKIKKLQVEFHLRFSRWLTSISGYFEDFDSITNQDGEDYRFLKLCTENLENISKENLDWFIPDESIFDQEK